jgi:DNA uptake protein ComE-like DNA-binding protein
MNLNREPIKNWFGFTRRERRSTFIMLLIVLLIICLRYTIPESRIEIEDITDTISGEKNHSELAGMDRVTVRTTIYSDQNSESKIRQYPDYNKIHEIKKEISEKPVSWTMVKHPDLQKAGDHSIQQKQRIDINISDSAALEKLYGIGPVLSARIIKYRRLLGGFARIDQLKEVYGLSAETYEAIKGRVFADSTVITRININSAGYKELSRFPYFEKYEITAILKYREIKRRINEIDDLTGNKLITNEKARKISPYLKF